MALLERGNELQSLEEHFRQAAAGSGRLVFVSGEAGVGKTALVDEFRRRVADHAPVQTFSCDALSTPRPLGPIRDFAAALGLGSDPALFAGEAREELFRAILAALATLQGPIVLIGEDAHWADGASLDFLRYIGRRVADLHYLHIITYRDDELGSSHPLRVILGDLAATPAVHRMAISPLSERAVHHLAEGSGRDAAALHRLTGGNPFFLTEMLASDGATVPATVGDAVLARAARLSPEARAILDLASVIGVTVDFDLLQRVAGPTLDEVEECLTRGLLRGTDDALEFRHALAREAILASISLPRRRLLHGRVLAALQEETLSEQKLALLAHHAEAAGDREAVAAFAIPAADEAAALHAHREAAAQYARALRFADRLPAAERARLLDGRSVACYYNDQAEEAIAARLEALKIWQTLGDARKEGECLRWLALCYELEGKGAEAEAMATAARDVLETLPPGPELAMAYSNLAQLRMFSFDLAGTLRWGEQAIALAEGLGDTAITVHALISTGTARSYAGDAGGEAELTRALELALATGLIDQAGRAYNNLAWTALQGMRLEEAEGDFATGIAFASDHDLDTYLWYLRAGQGTLRFRQGAWADAERELHALLRQPRLSAINRIMVLTPLGHLQARRGNVAARDLLDEALILAERAGQFSRLGALRAARAEAALLDGDQIRARAEAEAVRDLGTMHGNPWLRGELAWLLWRAGAPDVPVEGLAEPYVLQIEGEAVAAAALWQSLGCPYEEARALAESDDPAQVRRAVAAFERLDAQPAMRHAVNRLRSLGVRDVPLLRRGPQGTTLANPAGLTRREVEVLTLLAEGLRNVEIGERLYMSPKTVSHHVTAILAKLGVSSRTEAARAATKLGIAAG